MKKTFLGTVLLFFFAAVLMQAQNIAVQGWGGRPDGDALIKTVHYL